jgi:hypothetical protein
VQPAPPAVEQPAPLARPAAPVSEPEAARGWPGVEIASATTAPLPAPRLEENPTLDPGLAGVPLPLDPVYSSTVGIR